VCSGAEEQGLSIILFTQESIERIDNSENHHKGINYILVQIRNHSIIYSSPRKVNQDHAMNKLD